LCWLIGSASVRRAGSSCELARVLRESAGNPVGEAAVVLRDSATAQVQICYRHRWEFPVQRSAARQLLVSIMWGMKLQWARVVTVHGGEPARNRPEASADRRHVHISPLAEVPVRKQRRRALDHKEVSNLPLNSETSVNCSAGGGNMTDMNGAANFTQQFSVNGRGHQRRLCDGWP